MSPVPAGYDWALSTVGSKRHARVEGSALCSPLVPLSIEHDTDRVMGHAACKRCLVKTGGVE